MMRITIVLVNAFVSRQTQWDLPTWDQDQDDMDLGTPTHDEPQNKVSFALGFFFGGGLMQ